MKISNCYNCSCGQRTFYARENGFTLVKCSDCGLLYLKERPSDKKITQAHMQGKHSGIKELNVTGKFNEGQIAVYKKVLDDIFKGNFRTLENWLDVGCGHGEFMTALQEYTNGK